MVQVHALRHILLKALAFGVIAVMLPGVCAAQEVSKKMDSADYIKFAKIYENWSLDKKDALKAPGKVKYYKSYSAMLYFDAGNIEKSRFLSNSVLSTKGDNSYHDKLGMHLASYTLAEICIYKGDFKKGLDYLQMSKEKFPEPNDGCGFGDDWGISKEGHLYSRCYLNLGDTTKAIEVLLKSVMYAEKDHYNFIQDTLIELLYKKYPAYRIKQEFFSSFENYKKVKDYDNLFTIPVFGTDITFTPLREIAINKQTSHILLKEFLKTNFYKKLTNRAPIQWLFYPVTLN